MRAERAHKCDPGDLGLARQTEPQKSSQEKPLPLDLRDRFEALESVQEHLDSSILPSRIHLTK